MTLAEIYALLPFPHRTVQAALNRLKDRQHVISEIHGGRPLRPERVSYTRVASQLPADRRGRPRLGA